MGSRVILAGLCAFLPAYAQISVVVTPGLPYVHVGTYQQFTAKVTGLSPSTVTWSVMLPPGFTGSPGTITTGGRYTPPAALPVPNMILVMATSNANPAIIGYSGVSVVNAYPTLASVSPSNIPIGPYAITLNGSGFAQGAQAIVSGIPLATTYVSATKLTATGTFTDTQLGSQVPVVVTNPDPGSATSVDIVNIAVGGTVGPPIIPASVASRFLDQAAFGPNATTLGHVQAIGLDGYIKEQFQSPISPYPDPSTTGFGINQVQARFFTNAVHGGDQLRQRVAFALSQIFVASAVEESTPNQLVPYLRILQNDAFVNFRQLMEDVTLSPTMGEYLDMRNNDKADATKGTRANENYARELLQLFTIGLFQLNQDGTLKLDSSGNPIPTYDQTTIQNFAKVYTGWTYPTQPGAALQKHNPAYYIGPMVPFETNHDTTSKMLLNGLALPAGQKAGPDLEAALNNIFNHANVGPFIGKQLIQHLVTSNPTPAYVGRIAAVFNDNGSGVRGDLQAVIRAILLDPEARQGDTPSIPSTQLDPTGQHLREPVFVIASILRGLEASVNDTNTLTSLGTNLGQTLFSPPSVFSYFAPGYEIPPEFTPGATLLGPEFQLQSPSSSVARFNMVNTMVYGSLGNGAVIDFTNLSSLTTAQLEQKMADVFLHGQNPSTFNSNLQLALTAITGTTAASNKARAQAAVYLTVSSSFYNVEH